MAEIAIRPATATDADPLRRVIGRAYASCRDRLCGMRDVTAGLGDVIRFILVWGAEDGREIVGGVVLVLDTRSAKLANLAVDPGSGGRGIGRALIARVERAARDRGHATLDLVTHAAMADVQAFYARLGWVETGRDGVRVRMTKRL